MSHAIAAAADLNAPPVTRSWLNLLPHTQVKGGLLR